MILSDIQILGLINEGSILIEPFRRECLGSNSYDVHLGPRIGTYVKDPHMDGLVPWAELPKELDAKKPTNFTTCDIPDEGFVLRPGQLYLAATEEYTETHTTIPWLDGKSSVGRLGIRIHATAGRGDIGFMNHWTLEIDCVQPVRVYKGMPIGQLTYFQTGPVETPYNKKASAKYNGRSLEPTPSRMHLNFNQETGRWK